MNSNSSDHFDQMLGRIVEHWRAVEVPDCPPMPACRSDVLPGISPSTSSTSPTSPNRPERPERSRQRIATGVTTALLLLIASAVSFRLLFAPGGSMPADRPQANALALPNLNQSNGTPWPVGLIERSDVFVTELRTETDDDISVGDLAQLDLVLQELAERASLIEVRARALRLSDALRQFVAAAD